MEKQKGKILFSFLKLMYLFVCIWGVATSISMNLVNRSLWLDEAMLSYSFGKRTLLNLWDGAFEADQIAPLGWLYFVKLITVICGNTEYTLRIASILFYALTMVALYCYVHKSMGYAQLTALACAALYANLPFMLKYSNVFKPYIADGFFVLLVLISFAAWRKGKLQTWSLTLIWCVLIWFSNPVVFLQAGCLLVELFCALKEKKWTQFRQLFLVGAGILSCFVFYYLFWLRSVAVSDYMQGFWENNSFPLIPTSRQEVNNFLDSIHLLFKNFGKEQWAFFVLTAVVGTQSILTQKKREQLYIIVAIFAALAASWMRFFPISDRLWVFFVPLMIAFCLSGVEGFDQLEAVTALVAYLAVWLHSLSINDRKWIAIIPLFVLFCLVGLRMLRKHERLRKLLLQGFGVVVPLALVISGGGIQYYWGQPEKVYWPQEELNDEICWLEKHVQADEPVYVYYHSIYGWQYKQGNNNTSLGGYGGNVEYGEVPFNDAEKGQDEINKILKNKKIYIASSHLLSERFSPLAKALKINGNLELVLYEHRTPLWFFCKDLADSKIEASWEITKRDGDEFTVRIHNVGPAWLNHEYENVYLLDTVSGAKTALPKLVAPGKEIDLIIKCANEPEFMLMNDEGPICTERTFHHE